MSLRNAGPLTADATDLTVGLFLDPRMISKVERQIRDNRAVHDTIDLVGVNEAGSGKIFSQRATGRWYSSYTRDGIADQRQFQAWAERALMSSGFTSQAEPVKIQNNQSKNTVGFRTVVTVRQGQCFAARAGYRFGKTTIFDNDEDLPDTVIEVAYCGRPERFRDFELLVQGIAEMSPSDASAIRAKLASAGAQTNR